MVVKLPAHLSPSSNGFGDKPVKSNNVKSHLNEYILHSKVGGHARDGFRGGFLDLNVVTVNVMGPDPTVKANVIQILFRFVF